MTKNNSKPKKRRLFLKVIMTLIAGFGLFCLYFYLTLPNVEELKTKNPATTAFIEYRKAEAKEKGRKLTIRQKWVSFNAIPKLLKDTIRISEDAAFYEHDGIDYFELKESLKKNLKEGKKSRGGSTITQQLAKNLYLSPEKSYYRKIREFFIAKRLEKHLSKERIFHLYLNVIEFGDGIFGVESAAQYYFKKPVSQLGIIQIVRLASVIPKPLKVQPKSDSRYLKWRAKLLLNRLLRYGFINEADYKRARTVICEK